VRERFPNALGAVVTYGVYREGCRSELRGVGEVALPRGAGEVAEALERGGARVRVVDDIEPLRWAKLVVNAAINPVTAILRAPNGIVAEVPWARALAERLALEAAEGGEGGWLPGGRPRGGRLWPWPDPPREISPPWRRTWQSADPPRWIS